MTTSHNIELSQLNKTIDSHPSLAFEQGDFGICLIVNNRSASARIALFGAHLLSFIPAIDKRERLWLSERAIFNYETPIRGGVPICWPWFGAHNHIDNAPSHGFVRTQMWQLENVEETKAKNGSIVKTVCTFTPNHLGLHSMPKDCKLSLRITIANTCELILTTENQSNHSVVLSQAIHSYFAVGDINHVTIAGIDEPYFNKLDGTTYNECPRPYNIDAETDRVHSRKVQEHDEREQEITLIENNKHTLSIVHSGHNGTVVWNPWIAKSHGMQDMSKFGYQTMLCIEAVTEPEVTLAPGEQYVLTQRFA